MAFWTDKGGTPFPFRVKDLATGSSYQIFPRKIYGKFRVKGYGRSLNKDSSIWMSF